MAVLRTELREVKRGEQVVKSVPVKVYDHPCWEGCCKHQESMSIGDSYQVGWLHQHYMPEHGLKEFDYQLDWNRQVDQAFIVWRANKRAKMKDSQ